MKTGRASASFRDPSGFIFTRDGILYRQVNTAYAENYHQLIESGLYARLVKSGLLIPHEEVNLPPAEAHTADRILRPERVEFVSYPYEWSFSQLKDAALVTLAVQSRALRLGMSLKDASAYNVQLHRGKMTLIDTLSFEAYREGEPWVAYRQFCQHFLAPLTLMAYRDVRLGQLLRVHLDGIPLDLAAKLLPGATRFNPSLVAHIHLHARAQKLFADANVQRMRRKRSLSLSGLQGILADLRSTIRKLSWTPAGTEWAGYYSSTNYPDSSFQHKVELVERWSGAVKAARILDLGANNGYFSRLAARAGAAHIVSADIDPAAVEANYLQVKHNQEANLLPLLLDLTNPSPALGWENLERDGFLTRGKSDLVLALAIVHHLAISNNLPLGWIASFLAQLTDHLIVEFVPKSDSQVEKLLRNRLDIFPGYTREGFEAAFSAYFSNQAVEQIHDSQRYLYLMKRKKVLA